MSSYQLLPNFPLCKPSRLPISAHHLAVLPCKFSHGPTNLSLFFIFINITFLFFLFTSLVILSLTSSSSLSSSTRNLARAVCPLLVRNLTIHDP